MKRVLNKIFIVGNIGKHVFHEPKTEASKGITRFTLAVNDKSDESTMWLNAKLFKQMSESITVGSKVLVEGKLSEWTSLEKDKKGFEILAGGYRFLIF